METCHLQPVRCLYSTVVEWPGQRVKYYLNVKMYSKIKNRAAAWPVKHRVESGSSQGSEVVLSTRKELLTKNMLFWILHFHSSLLFWYPSAKEVEDRVMCSLDILGLLVRGSQEVVLLNWFQSFHPIKSLRPNLEPFLYPTNHLYPVKNPFCTPSSHFLTQFRTLFVAY